MKHSQIIIERDKLILKRLITFLFATFITLAIVIGVNFVEEGNVVTKANAIEKPVEVVLRQPDPRSRSERMEQIEKDREEIVAKVEEEAKELTIEDRIVNACDKYDIPSNVVLAIARLETGHFKSNAYLKYNNPGGMSRNERPIKYDTIEDGVEAFVSNLANNYFAIGLTTPETISKKYCPVNAEAWARLVTQLM